MWDRPQRAANPAAQMLDWRPGRGFSAQASAHTCGGPDELRIWTDGRCRASSNGSRAMDILLLLARLVLFAVFAVAGVSKLTNMAGSRKMMTDFGLSESLARPAGVALPIAELLVAALLLPVATAAWGAVGAFVLLVLFCLGIGYNLARGRTPDCRCFGQLHAAPVGPRTLVRNAVLALLAVPVAIRGLAGDPGSSAIGWLGEVSLAGGFAILGGVILVAALVGVGWLLIHLLGQNGRLLVRLDAIEAALGGQGVLDAAEAEEDADEGLPIGVPAPAFSLTGLHGETMTLDALRAAGKPVMLVFSDPNCGPCNAMMPDIGRWQRDHASALTTVVVTRGAAEANRAKATQNGLTHVLLQRDDEVADAYDTGGTPTGVIVRADGTIGSRAAPGADAIRKLVDRAVGGKLPTNGGGNGARPPQRPAAAQAPPPAANVVKPAPAVSLPDLAGGPVRLADFAGSRTAVLFWNPGCGFCNRMLPDLKAWEEGRAEDAPRLLVVSTGGVEENAAMGLASPVVLDQGFATGRAFGASGTPSAVVVDAEGKVASGIAVGAPAVLGLLKGAPPLGAGDEPAVAPAPSVGDPAPAVLLPDVNGTKVNLATHRGTRTMVLFWNPGCGFCEQLLPEIKQWEARPPKGAPKLIVVSTGSQEESRAMQLRSPVLLDPGFTAGSAFGADGTPSAVLVDARGNIASEIAVGGPDVMALARSTGERVGEVVRA